VRVYTSRGGRPCCGSVTEVRSALTWMARLFSREKSTNATSVPCPTNSVSLPSRNDGSSELCWVRSTTTSSEPLAASYRLSSVIDFRMTGSLRTVVVSANGFRNWGSR
jgi:hypothetical protein